MGALRQSGPSSLVRSLASNWVGLVVGVGIAFFLSPFVVTRLGAAWYGVWAVAGQFTGYLWLLDFGVRESIIRYTSKYAARKQTRGLNRVLTAALLIYSGSALLVLALTLALAWGVPYWFRLEPHFWRDARLALVFTGVAIAQTFLFNVFTGIVMGLRRWDLGAAIGVAGNLLRTALIVVFLLRGHGIVAIALIQCVVGLIAGAATLTAALWLLRERGLAFRLVRLPARKVVALSRRIVGYGFYVLVNNLGEKVITATDAIVVGTFLPIASVAYYAVAGSLVDFQKAIVTSAAPVFNPLASHLRASRQVAELRRALLFGITITVLVTLPVSVAFILMGEQFIRLWMGEEFAAPSGAVLAVLAAAAAISAPRYVVSNVLYGISRHRITAGWRLAEAVANLLLSVVLVRAIGLVGVALGTAIPAALIALLVFPIVASRTVGLRVWDYYTRAFVRPVLAVTPFAAGAYVFGVWYPAAHLIVFVAQVGALLLLYAPCAFAVALDREQRGQLLRRIGWSGAREPAHEETGRPAVAVAPVELAAPKGS